MVPSPPHRSRGPAPGSLAVVTGPTAGIGRVFAARLAARGHRLLLVARDATRLEALAAELGRVHGVEVHVVPADLAREADMDRVGEALAREPEIGMLVNNAGFGTRGFVHQTPLAPQMDMLRLHMLATHRLTHAVLPGMVAAGRGWIINVSSVAGFVYGPGSVNYNSTKAWLIRHSQALDAELHGTGVVVQALCPGFTHTEFHQRAGIDKRRIPSFLWMHAEPVVDASLAAARRGRPLVVIPGWRYRLIVAAARVLPHRLRTRLSQLVRRSHL